MSIVEPFEHAALYYRDVDEFLGNTLAFVREGLEAGAAVLVAVAEPRLSLVRDSIEGVGVTYSDMAEVGLNPNRILPWVLQAFVLPRVPGPTRVVVESIHSGRTPDEIPQCVLHEALTNLAFTGVDTSILCPYDTVALAHLLPYAERTHPTIVTSDGGRRSTSYTDPHTVVAILNQPLPEPRHIDESVAFDVQGLAAVRRLVGKHAEEAGLEGERVADLQLAVNEIGTNAVTYADAGVATLRLWSEPDRVVCEIRGAGEIQDIMAGRVLPDPESPRGRGLLIANRVCDLVQTHTAPTGTVTRLHMWLSPS